MSRLTPRAPGRRLAAAASIAIIGVIPAAGARAIAPHRLTANVTAFARPDHRLPPDPVLRVAEPVLVVVTGFASRTTVSVRVFRSGFSTHVRAGGDGVVHLSYAVGLGLPDGHYLMTFQGQPSLNADSGPGRGDRQGVRADGRQTITATIPRIGLFPFRLAGSTSAGGSGVGGVSVHRAPAEAPLSRLADTGADVVGLLLLAAMAGAVGAAALCLGRRRRDLRYRTPKSDLI